MTWADDEELKALRVRAYGPNADIHLDPEALHRLREREGEGQEPHPPASEPLPQQEARPAEQSIQTEEYVEDVPLPWFRRLATLRRSTVFIGIGLVALAACMAVTLLLVHRVQTAPLRVDANQVARLSVDPSYDIPGLFVVPSDNPDGGTSAFQGFLGLRTVLTSSAFPLGKPCLVVFTEATVAATSPTRSSKFMTGSCAAGGFPAVVQFGMDTDGLPAEVRKGFPRAKALQFVYDPAHREVVVFADE